MLVHKYLNLSILLIILGAKRAEDFLYLTDYQMLINQPNLATSPRF